MTCAITDYVIAVCLLGLSSYRTLFDRTASSNEADSQQPLLTTASFLDVQDGTLNSLLYHEMFGSIFAMLLLPITAMAKCLSSMKECTWNWNGQICD